jgi:hypothetical protein
VTVCRCLQLAVQSWGLLHFLLLSLHESFNIYDAVDVVFFLCTGGLDLSHLIRLPNYAFSNGFLHEVDLRLTNQFHVRVSQRNQHFRRLAHMLAEASGARNATYLLCGGENEEGIRL